MRIVEPLVFAIAGNVALALGLIWWIDHSGCPCATDAPAVVPVYERLR